MNTMDKIKSSSKVDFEITIRLSEVEARALNQLPRYGTDVFLKFFYEHLGKYYMEPHEKGIRSLFETLKQELPKHLAKVDKAREAFK